MTNGWQTVRIGEVAKPIDRAEAPLAGTTYRQIGVRLWGQGAYERAAIDGSQTKYATLSRVESGDIVVNKIWARNGSVAVITNKLAGCFGSGEFPTFVPDRKRLEPRWFHWITKTKWFWQACDEKSQGTSGKNRIRPEKFLEIIIPLPPLDEQQLIVTRIEGLAARITRVQSLRGDANRGANALWQSTLHRIFDEYQGDLKTLDEYTTFITDGTHVTPNYVDTGVPFVTVRNIANRKLSFVNLKYITQEQHEIYCKRVKAEYGDVLYTKDGTLGVPCFVDTQKEFSFFVSVAIIKPKHDLLDGRYLSYILDAPQVHEQVLNTKTGAVLQHIVIRAIKAINIPMPSLDEQRRIVAYLDSVQARLASLRELQSQTREELVSVVAVRVG